MKIVHLEHKHGGRITAINSIGHSTENRIADWYYVGDIEWSDGTKSTNARIYPWALCFDHSKPEAIAELNAVSEKMNDYLSENGAWHEPKTVGHHLVHWTPKQKEHALSV